MKRFVALAALGCAAGALSACSSDDTARGTDNQDPTIDELSANRSAVVTLATVVLEILASDPDGDELEYTWSADAGSLSATSGPGPITWTAPADRGTATISVSVDDGEGGAADASVEIAVKGWMASAAASAVPNTVPLSGVDFVSAEEGWATGGNEDDNVPYFFHFTSGSWVDETEGSVGHMHGVAALAADNVWTLGGAGLGYHYDGSSWTELLVPGGCIHGMTFFDANNGWATPAYGQVGMRHYSGGDIDDWTAVDTDDNGGIDAVGMASASDGWAVGPDGTMLHYDGTQWTAHDGPTEEDLHSVLMLAPDDGWTVGSDGSAYRYDGAAWTLVDTPVEADLLGLGAADAQSVWAVGEDGTILFFDGSTWLGVPSPTAADLHAVAVIDQGEAWIVGYEGTILHLE